MVKTVNMDLMVSKTGTAERRDTDAGFSDVLGKVNKENRKQPGLSGKQKSEAGKEFSFTKKASEAVRNSDSGSGRQVSAKDESAADKVISDAVEAVVREVAGTGETPSPEKAAEMLGDALKKAVGKAETEKDAEITGTAEEILNAVIDAVAAYTAGTGEEMQTGIAEEEAGTVTDATVHVISPDSSFLMTEKHSEMAVITSGMEEDAADDEDLMSFDDEFARMFERSVVERFTGKTDFTEIEFTDRESLIENVLSRLGDDTGIDGEPIADMQAVKDTAQMLGDIIAKAKNELGLTDVRLEHIVGENDAAVPLIADQPVKLSQSMNHRDRTDELDRILSGSRTDIQEEPEAVKTQTYDAVHMQESI
ncbi:MAG: hypothetical protein J6X60_02305, partial [Ruminiclostridium sp.]|nr:hypothetical protein [Ruminiclostridium sp.]